MFFSYVNCGLPTASFDPMLSRVMWTEEDQRRHVNARVKALVKSFGETLESFLPTWLFDRTSLLVAMTAQCVCAAEKCANASNLLKEELADAVAEEVLNSDNNDLSFRAVSLIKPDWLTMLVMERIMRSQLPTFPAGQLSMRSTLLAVNRKGLLMARKDNVLGEKLVKDGIDHKKNIKVCKRNKYGKLVDLKLHLLL